MSDKRYPRPMEIGSNIMFVFAIIGVLAVVGAVAFGVYCWLTYSRMF